MTPSLRRPWITNDVDPHVPEIPKIPRRYCHAVQGAPGAIPRRSVPPIVRCWGCGSPADPRAEQGRYMNDNVL